MSVKNPSDFTVGQLKEKLRELDLSSTENKLELICRLIEVDPSGQWMKKISKTPESDITIRANPSKLNAKKSLSAAYYEREIEMYRWENELAERELQIVRREIELMKETQQLNMTECGQTIRQESTFHDSSRASITAIAKLLSCFDGSIGDYENWERQLKLFKTTYRLSDEYVKILIGMQLKGKALE